MRATLLPLALLALLLPLSSAATAQAPPPQGVTSEDLLEEPTAAPALASPPEEVRTTREQDAEQAFMNGELALALTLYRELAAGHPAPPEGTRLRVTAAWLEFQLGNAEGAGRALAGALVEDPDYQPRAEIYSPEFMALFLDAQRDAAEERARRAAQRLKQGIDALAAGDTKAARRAVGESLELAPGSLRALLALAQVDLADRATDAALAGFERVLALERGAAERLPRNLKAQVLNNIGFIYFGRGQYEDALQALDEAAALDNRDPQIWFNLGLARQKLALAGPGLDALRTAHELDRRDAEIALELGRAYGAAGRFLDAVSVLLGATQLHGGSAPLWLELGLAQRGLGNSAGMTASLGKAIELDPANGQGAGFRAAMELAQTALAAKDFGTAVTAAQTAARLKPSEGSAWALLGLAEQAAGRLPEAAQGLEKAAEVAPDRADIAHNLGTVYLAQRRYAEAEAAFRRALALDPKAVEAEAALSQLAAQRAAAESGRESGRRKSAAKPAAAQPPVAKRAERPALGAELTAVDYAPLGIRGLLVEAVAPGGLADRAGLLVDDLVLRAGGRPVTQASGLRAMIESSHGISIQLSVLRAGKSVEVILHP